MGGQNNTMINTEIIVAFINNYNKFNEAEKKFIMAYITVQLNKGEKVDD